MTVELITGHAGSAHVSSSDVGWFNAGTVGAGKYVLDTGTHLAAEVQSANLVTIGVGDAVFEGRHVRVSATENVAIDNGAQDINRNDIICIKYEYDGDTGVESASIEVVKGTGSSGTPSDPTIPSGSILTGSSTAYMPLWRIPIEGITVGTPEKLYGDVLVTLEGMLSKVWSSAQIPNLAASKITSGTLDAARIPNLDAAKITSGTLDAAQIPSLAASKITSGTFQLARIPNIDAERITSGTLALGRIPNINAERITSGIIDKARGGTGKNYGYTWQQLGTSTGSSAISFSLSDYSEVLVACYAGTTYMGTAVIPKALLSSTAKQLYLGGGVLDHYATNGRYVAANVTSSKLTPVVARADESDIMSSCHWYVYAR